MRISTASATLGSLYGLSAVFTGPYRNHYASLRPAFDEGEGMGEGAGSGEGETEYEATDIETDEVDEVTGAKKTVKAHSFKSENAKVMLPGMTKPMTVKELNAALGLKGTYENGLKTVTELTKALKAGDGKGQQGQQKGQQGQQQKTTADKQTRDVLGELEKMELLDGKSVAAVLREINQGTISPMLATVIAMAKEMKDIRAHIGGAKQRDFETGLKGEIGNAINSLSLPRVGNAPIEGEEVLHDLVQDLIASYHEEDQPKLRGDVLNKLVKGRLDAILKFARNYEKANLEAARQRGKARLFPKPGANGSANGKARPRLTNRQASEILFAGSAAE